MTSRQEMVLRFIRIYMEEKRVSPTLQNIAEGLGMRSRSNIHRIVHSLKKMGHLKVGTGFRAIELR